MMPEGLREQREAALERLGGIRHGDVFTVKKSSQKHTAFGITAWSAVAEVIQGKQMDIDPRYIEFVLRPKAWQWNIPEKTENDVFLLDE